MRLPAVLIAALSVVAVAGAAQAGCLTGAAVGGVAGHYAGRHTGVGIVGGCVVGHEMAKKKQQDRLVAQGKGYYDARHHFHRN